MNNLKNKYTSLELSKKLAENGCDYLKPTKYWQVKSKEVKLVDEMYSHPLVDYYYPAYDILWDICVKYARQFFGKPLPADLLVDIFMAMVSNKKQEAEDYIWQNCLFNKKNKI